jgi:hypothetical protein
MAAPRFVGGVSVVIDPAEWFRLKQDLDKFDPELAKALRRRIKNAGQTAADRVKQTLGLPSPDGGPNRGSSRQALIAATRVAVSFSAKQAGAKITTSASGLPAEHKGLLNVYNKSSFRHPVFAEKGATRGSHDGDWVYQEGRPYFGKVILEALNKETMLEIERALDEATRAIGARIT